MPALYDVCKTMFVNMNKLLLLPNPFQLKLSASGFGNVGSPLLKFSTFPNGSLCID